MRSAATMRVWVTATWVVMVVVVVARVSDQEGQHHTLVQPQQSTELGNEDGTSIDVSGEGTRNYRIRQATNDTSEGSGSGGGGVRQYGGPTRQYGGGRRQYGGGRARQYPRIPHRQHNTRPSGGSVTGEGRSFGIHPGVGDDRESVGVLGSEIPPRQMDTLILLLQRLSDRLVGMETLQRQRAERIDTIQYRLTRIELQADERKGVITELSNTVRHRMETTDAELDRITSTLDQITTSITALSQRQVELQNTINEIPEAQSEREGRTNGLKLQAMMATVHGLRTATQAVREDIGLLVQNFTVFGNITNKLNQMSQEMVTKQYLQQNLNELNTQDSSLSLLAKTMLMQPQTGRRGGGSRQLTKGEAEDCWEVQQEGRNQSGVYRIKPRYSPLPFFVYCDMETDGGGWTVIQRREDGTVDFLREWPEYKYGFGNLAGELWLGNERIHQLTSQYVSQLRVDLADFDQQISYAKYSAFAIGSELEGYSLKMLGQYMGDAGDSLRYQVGRRFSTPDVDNDAWPERSCARDHQGAWWYRACETSNLNGRYLHGPLPPDHQYTGLYWYDFRGPRYSLWRSRMMVRRGGTVSKPVFKNFTELQNNPVISRSVSSNENTTSPAAVDFNPDHDPYATYEYPYY